MSKPKYQFEIIGQALADKGRAIAETEGVCPTCGDRKSVSSYKHFIAYDIDQWEYKCEKCGTKWVGNCYTSEFEYVPPKKVKRILFKETLWEYKSFIGILALLVVVAFCAYNIVKPNQSFASSTSGSTTTVPEVSSEHTTASSERLAPTHVPKASKDPESIAKKYHEEEIESESDAAKLFACLFLIVLVAFFIWMCILEALS